MATWDDETVRVVAKRIIDECGDWTLSELGDAGLSDAIWEAYTPFQSMTPDERNSFHAAVWKEIYA